MTAASICPQCGTPLLSGAAGGLCPKCLGSLGFAAALFPEENRPVSDEKAPHRLGDYELLEEIARGGMGVVYRARQLSLNRTVAVKVVLHGPFSSPEFVQRFRTETAAIATLQHPNIVAIYEVGAERQEHFFSMQYIDGPNLAEVVRGKPLPTQRAAEYLQTIAATVAYAHQRGVLHRDLKPSNVLLDAFSQPHITDFGLAKLLGTDADLTTTGQVLGSPNYIAPEQAVGKRHEVGPAADIYSLGAILYHLITGNPPFQGETLQDILLQVQNVDPVAPRRLNPSVPVDLQTICLKCLQKEPGRRYRSAQELADDLRRFLDHEPIEARAVSALEKLWLWGKRHPVLAALTMALHLVVILGLAGILWQWRRAEDNARGEHEQRRAAEDYAARVRLNLYAGDVSFAARALQRGDLGLARRTLEDWQPQAGESDLRGFEWYCLWSRCHGEQLAELGKHEWIVTCTDFSPTSQWLATGSQDHSVKIWDVARRALVTTLPAATGAVWSVTFTPEGRQLVTAGQSGVTIWDCATWQPVRHLPGQTASLALSAPLLASVEVSFFYWWQPPGAVTVWNYATGEKLRTFPKPGRTAALAPDGSVLAVAGLERGVDLWEVTTGILLRTIESTNAVRGLEFSPDSQQLVIMGRAMPPVLHDLRGGHPPRAILGHTMEVWDAAFTADGSVLATTSSDQTVRLTNLRTGTTKSVLRGHEHEVWSVAFSHDGKTLATGGKDRRVLLWSPEAPPATSYVPNQGTLHPFFSPDGKQIVTTGTTNAPASSAVRGLNDLSAVQEIKGRRTMSFTADGQRLVRWGRGAKSLSVVTPNSTNVTAIPLEYCDDKSTGVEYQGFTLDGKTLFYVDQLGRVAVWDATSGKLLNLLQGPPPPISAGSISPGGRFLALGAQKESVIRLYDLASGREEMLRGHRDTIRGLAFSADDATLASGSLDGTIRLWKTRPGTFVAELPGHMEETSAVAFSPDGRTLASVNMNLSVKLWHIPTQRELVSWDFPNAGDFLTFSPDGRFLALTTRTNSVYLFDAPPASP